MRPTQFFFVRHGESEANLLNVFSNRGTRHGLTCRGKKQAGVLAEELKTRSFNYIYSSPLLRAVQTAEILAHTLSVPWEITDALREYDCGVLEGKSDQDSWELHLQVLESWINHSQWDARIEGGESFVEIKERFLPFVGELIHQNQASGGRFILVGHGGIFRVMLPLLFENIDYQFVMDHAIKNTGYVLAEAVGTKLTCIFWDETTFVDDLGQEFPEPGR